MNADDARIALAQLRAWAGETAFERGQDYEARGRVSDLAANPAGGVVAWVQGSSRYATQVTLDKHGLASACTCPYGDACKHAVAVALAYLNRSPEAPPLPVAPVNDPRLVLLDRQAAVEELADFPYAVPKGEAPLRTFLAAYSNAELVALLVDLAYRFPEVRDALAVRQMLASEDSGRLESEVLQRIRVATAEPAWRHRWKGGGHEPDYGPVYDGLRRLLDLGHADAVVRLGEELLEAGITQVEQSHDEGETAMAVASCLKVVFEALPSSTLAPHQQLLWAIDALLRDPYDLCHDARDVLEEPYPPEVWNTGADELLARLEQSPATAGDFTREYRRQGLADFAILALETAGRDDEILPLCEREAQENGSYQRLVERLLALGRNGEAEQWARTGMAATMPRYPGIAAALREVICTLRAQAGDWAMVAAMRAQTFFDIPSLPGLRTLEAAAERAGVGPAVRAAALHYLETGQLPQRKARSTGGMTIPAWPLPDTGISPAERRYPLQFPQIGPLIDVAIAEDRPDEVLRWYDLRNSVRGFAISDDTVAGAVVQAHPERAAEIWQRLAETEIAKTNPAAYEIAARFLRKLRRARTEQGKAAEWRAYVEELRATNRRKRRLIQTLDALLLEDE